MYATDLKVDSIKGHGISGLLDRPELSDDSTSDQSCVQAAHYTPHGHTHSGESALAQWYSFTACTITCNDSGFFTRGSVTAEIITQIHTHTQMHTHTNTHTHTHRHRHAHARTHTHTHTHTPICPHKNYGRRTLK